MSRLENPLEQQWQEYLDKDFQDLIFINLFILKI